MPDIEIWTYLASRANDLGALTEEIFRKMKPAGHGSFVSDLGYILVGKDAAGFQVLRPGEPDNSERFARFEQALHHILKRYW